MAMVDWYHSCAPEMFAAMSGDFCASRPPLQSCYLPDRDDLPLQQRILEAQDTDDVVRHALSQLKEQGISELRKSISDWKVTKGLVFYKDRCYVPHDLELHRNIVRRYHELGHDGSY